MNRVKYTTTTTGTGALTVSLETGYQAPGSATVIPFLSTRFPYILLDANGTDWEHGLGSLSGSTLTRQAIIESTNSGSAINLTSGSHTLFVSKAALEGMTLLCAIKDNTPAAISANTMADVSSGTLQFDTVVQDDLATLPTALVTDTAADEVTTPINEWQYPLENCVTGFLKAWRATLIVQVPSTATTGNVGIQLGTYFETPYAAAWAPFINGRANTVTCTTPWIGGPQPDGTAFVIDHDHISPGIYNDSAASLTCSRIELWVEFKV